MKWSMIKLGPPSGNSTLVSEDDPVTIETAQDAVGYFQALVLQTVEKLQGDAYGMRIRDEVQIVANRAIHMPQIYAALSRLEVLGLVSSDASPKNSVGLRGRTRRYYEISARGLQQLSDVVRHSRGAGPKDLSAYEEWVKAATA